ncbi:hypothetical protein L6164_027662 [Bauhinia variegata]|uniref:Uncharacterized protein n=1 Tax=Bauhinia variegata TaxID=167791 RepID=A0ACB9LV09_BAUVA|nr:hypothetical protein L6164_027662 [Bauhinia variegata]
MTFFGIWIISTQKNAGKEEEERAWRKHSSESKFVIALYIQKRFSFRSKEILEGRSNREIPFFSHQRPNCPPAREDDGDGDPFINQHKLRRLHRSPIGIKLF